MEDSFFSISSIDDCQSREIPYSDSSDGKIVFSAIPYKSVMIVLMNHPASITIKNHVSIRVLSGSVSVFGYSMDAASEPLKALSLKTTGLVKIKTESSDCIWEQNNDVVLELKSKINNITQNAKRTENLLNKMENNTVVICIRLCVLPTCLQFLEFYFPKMLKSEESSSNKHDRTLKSAIIESTYKPIEFGLDEEKIIYDISEQIRNARLELGDAPRIVIFGSRNTGKSTLIRYLINRILKFSTMAAYYLDTDPGQTEFTPPGVVSFNKVTEAIIGPPFFHQNDPTAMVFTGDISVSSIDMYSNSVSKLMQLYTDKYKNEPLFVNTMGWIQGLGLECLANVLKIVNPTIVVELVNEDEISMIDYREYVSENTVYHMKMCTHGQKNSYPAKSMREFSIISYLGKSLSPYIGVVPMNKIRPYCVSWDKLAMYVFNKGIPPWRLVEALSLSIVALCAVSESSILVSEKQEFPMTLVEDPENECIGFGLVRAIDEDKHLFYIVTPLELYELKRVNALMKGNIMIPNVVLLNQGIEGTPLPYLRDVEVPTPHDIEDMSIQDGDSFSSNFKTAELYGKNVPKRFGRKR